MSELRIERIYQIPPERLFAYLTETGKLLKWWGPQGAEVTQASVDFTRRGPWSLALDSPRGAFEMRGVVTEVIPHCLVEFTMNVPGLDAPDSTVRFEIEPDGKGSSRLTLIQSGITDEMVAMGRNGWGATLARLEKLVGDETTAV